MATIPRQVVIVGGGIAGLATAFALQERAAGADAPISCTLLDAAPDWGGKILTRRVGDLIIESGPDSFLSQKPWALELIAKLGLADQVINTNEHQKKTFVYSRGRLRALPEGLVVLVPTRLGPFFRSGLVSWAGLARMALDLVLPARQSDEDESLASFFRRRLGREAFERMVEPLLAGIYAGDAERMSLRATFPRFLELERRHGSLIRGMLAARPKSGGAGGRGGPGAAGVAGVPARTTFVTLRGGLGDLVRALVNRVTGAGIELRASCRAATLRVRPTAAGPPTYEVLLAGGGCLRADAVVLATPAYVSADLLEAVSRPAAEVLREIPYASTATVSLVYDAEQLGPAVSGFGFVVPRVEGRALIAATWSSLKWPGRAPPGQALIRCYLGGAGREAILGVDDRVLLQVVRDELRALIGLAAEPVSAEVHRWERAMPQYTLGHLDRLTRLRSALAEHPGLFLTGAAYRGIGIPDCIRDGTETAASVVEWLAKPES
ncbi:protoporphyrinogen oxidase [Nitrospira sp. Kam-Ns4a]